MSVRADSRSVACPTCRVLAGLSCVDDAGRIRGDHPARRERGLTAGAVDATVLRCDR